MFAIIRVYEYYPEYQGQLVFQYVWLDQGELGIDWLVNLAPCMGGLISAVTLTIIMFYVRNRKEKKYWGVGPSATRNIYRELFCWIDE